MTNKEFSPRTVVWSWSWCVSVKKLLKVNGPLFSIEFSLRFCFYNSQILQILVSPSRWLVGLWSSLILMIRIAFSCNLMTLSNKFISGFPHRWEPRIMWELKIEKCKIEIKIEKCPIFYKVATARLSFFKVFHICIS